MCPVCQGSGEVSAGVTTRIVQFGAPDEYGVRSCFPVEIAPNPDALDMRPRHDSKSGRPGIIWILQANTFVELWGIAVCAKCHGTGSTPAAQQPALPCEARDNQEKP